MGLPGLMALGAAIIGGGIAVTKKDPYSAKDVKGAIGIAPPPTLGDPPVMPDQGSLTQAQTLQESKDAAMRYGRAATVLTGTGADATTNDKLGP
jgi:hypothetical protein